MEEKNESKLTREEVLKRLQTSKQRKKERLQAIEAELREEYKEQTGAEPKYFFAW